MLRAFDSDYCRTTKISRLRLLINHFAQQDTATLGE